MRGVTGLALIFALVLGMLAFTQIGGLERELTTLTGGMASFVATIPTRWLFVTATVAMLMLVGFVGLFTHD